MSQAQRQMLARRWLRCCQERSDFDQIANAIVAVTTDIARLDVAPAVDIDSPEPAFEIEVADLAYATCLGMGDADMRYNVSMMDLRDALRDDPTPIVLGQTEVYLNARGNPAYRTARSEKGASCSSSH